VTQCLVAPWQSGRPSVVTTSSDSSATSASDWVRLFAEELGTTAPAADDVDDLLAIAGMAAHASERTAAPLSTWLVGRAGVAPSEAKAAAARLAAELSPAE
jgi:Domain of unknown function (DUF6457)